MTMRDDPPSGPLLRYKDGSTVRTEDFLIVWFALTGSRLVVNRHHDHTPKRNPPSHNT